jgi:hypothetical protein
MRELKRSIAHANMEKKGIKGVNKKTRDNRSFFARNWRKFVYV